MINTKSSLTEWKDIYKEPVVLPAAFFQRSHQTHNNIDAMQSLYSSLQHQPDAFFTASSLKDQN